MSAPVDVLAVMDAARSVLKHEPGIFIQVVQARAAVAELIEADTAFNVAFNEWINDKTSQTALDALGNATDVRAAALARVQGGDA